jgi:REP element-mobilizing transposase RayT
MAQSLSNVLLHVVFSTKNRQPWIDTDIAEELLRYVGGICRELKCPTQKIGGVDDHVHIACSLSRTITIAKLVEEIKTGSSKWIKTKGDRFADFAWQNGYGAFSIGQSQLADLIRYIANQREHHRRVSYQDEFRQFLAKYEIEYDERYVWD